MPKAKRAQAAPVQPQRLDRLARIGNDDEDARAAAATIFSRRWAPPPPLISQPSGVTWSVPSIAMSSRSSSLNSSTGMPSSRACCSVVTEVATQRIPLNRDWRSPATTGRPWTRFPAQPSSRPRPAPPRPRRRCASLVSHRRAPGTCRDFEVGVGDLCSRTMDARIWLTGKGAEPRSVPLAGRTTVGRDPRPTPDHDEAVSWNHLELEMRGGVLMATDLDSRNGARVRRRAARAAAPPRTATPSASSRLEDISKNAFRPGGRRPSRLPASIQVVVFFCFSSFVILLHHYIELCAEMMSKPLGNRAIVDRLLVFIGSI